MKRTNLFILLALIIGAVIIVYITTSKSTDSTANEQQQKTQTFIWEKITVRYPENWKVYEFSYEQRSNHGGIASFGPIAPPSSPEPDCVDCDSPAIGEGAVLSSWSDINDVNALGGSWQNMQRYRDLQHYMGDMQGLKRKIGEFKVDQKTVYEVEIAGISTTYALMFEDNGEIYELSFPSAWDKSRLTENQKFILKNLSISQ